MKRYSTNIIELFIFQCDIDCFILYSSEEKSGYTFLQKQQQQKNSWEIYQQFFISFLRIKNVFTINIQKKLCRLSLSRSLMKPFSFERVKWEKQLTSYLPLLIKQSNISHLVQTTEGFVYKSMFVPVRHWTTSLRL